MIFPLAPRHGVAYGDDCNSHGGIFAALAGCAVAILRRVAAALVEQPQAFHQQSGRRARDRASCRSDVEVNLELSVGPAHRLEHSRFAFKLPEPRVLALPAGKIHLASLALPAHRELAGLL